MAHPLPRVGIVLVNWNGKADTLECLRSLESVDYEDLSVLVVDNGSEGDDVDAIRHQFPHVLILENGRNLGFGAANNRGIEYAIADGADYVLLLNNDTTVDPDFLRIMVRTGEGNPEYGILSPTIYSYPDGGKEWFGGGRRVSLLRGTMASHKNPVEPKDDSLIGSQVVTGAAMLIKRAVIEKVGFLPTTYFLGWEDYDYCLRARRVGLLAGCVKGARIYHKVSRSFAKFHAGDTHRRTWLYRRGQVIFLARNAPFWKFGPALIGTAVYALIELIRLSGENGQRATGPPSLLMALRGVISGFISLTKEGAGVPRHHGSEVPDST